jgi:threonine synthase
MPQELATGNGRGLWRYLPWLPLLRSDSAVSLDEGATPLAKLDQWSGSLGLGEVYAKLEYAGPTGSFKDRGASVLVSHARAIGARRITEDSSGNAGASLAAYAARAGLVCSVFAPADTPAGKLAQIRSYGATLVEVEGPRAAAATAARTAGLETDSYYAGHNTNPFFVEGCKTLAFELVEAFEAEGPEHVVIPVGGGSLYCGAALGFSQLLTAGLIHSMPRLHLVQATGCMPLVAAFESRAEEPLPVPRRPTIAGGIVIENPARGRLILRALKASRGVAVAVDDSAIRVARQDLARQEGIYMEPTSAAAFAGLARLAANGTIARNERVVVAVTGSGLKDPEPV